ncbi:hypothetical protein QZH41_010410 [Actinostola sp. cb2023]|nr:hypothetical protein QZH41_010410 [Actinostola sp. cb2023]
MEIQGSGPREGFSTTTNKQSPQQGGPLQASHPRPGNFTTSTAKKMAVYGNTGGAARQFAYKRRNGSSRSKRNTQGEEGIMAQMMYYNNHENSQFHGNKYWNQVNLDVDRSHRRFPHETGARRRKINPWNKHVYRLMVITACVSEMRASRRKVLQSQLTNIIMRVLCKNSQLHYYQGYHDIAVTLLLVAGEDLATALLEKISLHQLRDYMDVTMEKTTKMLSFMHPIIDEADPELERFLIQSEVGQIFALSWCITWYGHVLKDFDTIVRLFDFFLATHPLMPVYLATALVIDRREEVLLGECEMSFVHHMMSRIPENFPCRVEEYIISAQFLFDKYSPEKLAGAVEKYLKESMAVAKHNKSIQELGNQRPDSVLRERRIKGSRPLEMYQSVAPGSQSSNPYVKVAVWTLTASLGTIALYVLGSAKRWI